MMRTIVSGVVRLRWGFLLLFLGLAYLASLGQSRLGFSTDYRVYLAPDNPELMAQEQMQATFDRSDNLFIVVAPESGDVFSQSSLEALQWITLRAWQTPYSVRVDSLSNFQNIDADADNIQVADLVRDAAALNEQQRQRVRTIALSEPQLVGRLVSKAGSVAAVNVVYHLAGVSPYENSEVVSFARQLAEEAQAKFPGIKVHLTGMAMYNNAFLEAALGDAANLTPWVYLVILIAALIMLRSVLATVAAVAVVYLAMTSAEGIAGWLGMSLTSLSASAPLVILMIAVADSVHVLSVTLMHLRKGATRLDALREALHETLVPVTVTSLTTAVAFLSLNFSEIPPFRDLGNIVSIGIALAWLFTLFLLPGLVALLPLKPSAKGDPLEHAMTRFGTWVQSRSRMLMWLSIPVVVVLASLAGRNELNDQYLRWFSPETAFRQANDYTEQNLTGLYTIEYALKSKSSSGVNDPVFLAQVEAYTTWLRQQSEVAHVSSLSDVVKRVNRSLTTGTEEAYRLPESTEVAAQSLLLYEQSLPYGLDLNNQIDVSRTVTRSVVALHELSTRQMLDFERRSMSWLASNAPGIEAKAASTTLIFAHIGQRNIESMMWGIIASAAVVAFLLMLLFRSWKLGLLSMVPNVIPAAMALGIWWLCVGQVGFSVAIVASMTLGVVVDDTIHFMYAVLQRVKSHGQTVGEAVVEAFTSTAPALLVTSLTLTAGFLVQATSEFALNQEMGLMTALTLVIALLADFFLLPGLLELTLEKKRERTEEREVPGDAVLPR
ncbi:hypothetical protein SAMN04489798_1993 [Pseudomonas arsenicoxydans]|uniref:SSD domain-containing protein n=1 Tax=Pseudomonas arsenicoxydans TaxID=702115 RepID=A0A1H0GRN9_9PSED|nr:MMPL family transporter [Pseudomonas arsenicoxydans]SDO09567.1 hypothetical protein SAMN04489798_1993 [Pseudomonas arsenicoxydans]